MICFWKYVPIPGNTNRGLPLLFPSQGFRGVWVNDDVTPSSRGSASLALPVEELLETLVEDSNQFPNLPANHFRLEQTGHHGGKRTLKGEARRDSALHDMNKYMHVAGG